MTKKKPHPLAEQIMEYALDAAETDEPWKRWEYYNEAAGIWMKLDGVSMHGLPVWRAGWKYRRKPRTININGIEVPEPMREAPAVGQPYWMVELSREQLVSEYTWIRGNTYCRWLSNGLIHSTREAAQLHAKALLSFTQKGGEA